MRSGAVRSWWFCNRGAGVNCTGGVSAPKWGRSMPAGPDVQTSALTPSFLSTNTMPVQTQPSQLSFRSLTRLHSSRMHTTHVLTVSPSILCGGGVSALWGHQWQEGVYYSWGGCVFSHGLSATGRVSVSQHSSWGLTNQMCYRCHTCQWNLTLHQLHCVSAKDQRCLIPKMPSATECVIGIWRVLSVDINLWWLITKNRSTAWRYSKSDT